MNKEFMILSDGNIVVTDENSHISKRAYDSNSQNILLAENKLEIVNSKLNELNKNLSSQEGVISLSNCMLAFQFIIIALITICEMLYWGIANAENFLAQITYNGIHSLLRFSIIAVPTTIYFSIVKSIYKKKINKTTNEIEIAESLIKEYEKELENLKEKQMVLESPSIAINEPVSLVAETNIIENQITEEFNRSYNENLNQQPQKLVRRKNNKKI